MQLDAGCVGDGTTATDLILDIRGDGRTYGPGEDAVRITNARPGASNLQIEGRADCGGRVGDAHQDGIQVLGGTNITFRNFEVGNYDAGLSTCQGAGGAFFYSMASTNTRVEGGKYIACNHSLFAGTAGRPRLGRHVPLGPHRRHRPGLRRLRRLRALHGPASSAAASRSRVSRVRSGTATWIAGTPGNARLTE